MTVDERDLARLVAAEDALGAVLALSAADLSADELRALEAAEGVLVFARRRLEQARP